MTKTDNPWITALPQDDEVLPPVKQSMEVKKAFIQQPSVSPPPHRLERKVHVTPHDVWFVGAHGGAGETTLASLKESWGDAGHTWPLLPQDATPRVVLVARTHYSGLLAAQDAIQHWASGVLHNVELVGLVLIADAPGRLPRSLKDLAKHISGGVPHTWHLGWQESLRVGEPDLTTDMKRLIKAIETTTQ